ncbi:hypothetical protein Nmel_014150 [Mimus melanotis]
MTTQVFSHPPIQAYVTSSQQGQEDQLRHGCFHLNPNKTTNSLQAQGPIGKRLSALIIGRSSDTLQGIFVYAGIINADFTRQIQATVSTPTLPVDYSCKNKNYSTYPF